MILYRNVIIRIIIVISPCTRYDDDLFSPHITTYLTNYELNLNYYDFHTKKPGICVITTLFLGKG